jgi:hypothetical protein
MIWIGCFPELSLLRKFGGCEGYGVREVRLALRQTRKGVVTLGGSLSWRKLMVAYEDEMRMDEEAGSVVYRLCPSCREHLALGIERIDWPG